MKEVLHFTLIVGILFFISFAAGSVLNDKCVYKCYPL